MSSGLPLAVPRVLLRTIAAAPDALTSFAYAWTWLRPLDYQAEAVKTLMLVMLLEFLVVHSGAFIGTIVLSDAATKRQKTIAILCFGAFYMLFAGAFSLAFHAWWPALTFLWLLGSRFAMVWLLPLPRSDEAARQMGLWALSVAAYLGAVFFGVLVPLPELGLTREVIPKLDLSGSGLWVEFPQTVMASGMLYFAAVAWSKWAWQPKS